MENKFNGKYLTMILGILLILGFVFWQGGGQDQPASSPKKEEPAASSKPSQPENQVAYVGDLSPLIQQKCLQCHATDGQRVERISDVRKSPEGWGITLSRMQRAWGLEITDGEKKQLIKDLSKTNGLAPTEMEPVMYWLTKKGSQMEDIPDPSFEKTCIRCHAIGQPLAQRRTAEEWDRLKDFHVAYNPSMVYQLRDVNWDEVAGAAIDYLKENYPMDNSDYRKWRENPPNLNPEGKWKIVGISPTEGLYTGTSSITKVGEDTFTEERNIHMGEQEINHQSNITLYSGFALRSSQDGTEKYRGYYSMDGLGKKISGSRVKVGDNGIFADEVYYATDTKQVVDLWPRSIPEGKTVTVQVVTTGLPGQIQKEQVITDPVIEVLQIVKQQNDELWIEMKAKDVVDKAKISIQGVEQELSLRVFKQVDFIKVTPEYGRGRIAYETHQESVQFQAIAYAYGADGKQDTEDDIVLGPVKAKWKMIEHEQYGIDDHDIKFIGKLDPESGLFSPAIAGPNEKREWKTNNAGGVKVQAVYKDPVSGQTLQDDAFLLNTVPDFVVPIN